MKDLRLDPSTDVAWEEWGRRDPYYGVLTDPKFRRRRLTADTRKEFFDSGQLHVNYVMQIIREHIAEKFEPKRILDFGCGVGRTLLALAAECHEVLGLDVSPTMLQEARLNCAQYGVKNARLLVSDDALSVLTEQFDFIHSCIVFQHIPVERGRTIFTKLLQHMSPGGVGAVQVTYSKVQFAATHGVMPPVVGSPRTATKVHEDPEIQMNPYNMNEWLFLMQRHGVARFHSEFTDHGGELGLFLFFQKP